MQVKTFEAISFKDAVKQIKKEFGSDAVIISTKEKPLEGSSRGTVVEVTAAMPESHRPGATAKPTTQAMSELSTAIDRLNGIDSRISAVQGNLATKTQAQAIETGLAELKMMLLETLRGRNGSTVENLPFHLVNIDRQLRVMGVDESHVVALVKHLKSLPMPDDVVKNGNDALEEHSKSQAIRWMLKKLKVAPRWTLMSGTQTVQAFVGPCGSGKTSVIAKLAAHYVGKERAKVAIFSCDTDRLAGTESLRLYAKILGIPFVPLSDLSELQDKVLQHRDRELILIDTPGRSVRADGDTSTLSGLRSGKIPVDLNLVVAATEKSDHLDRSLRTFAPLGLQSLIFTKFDDSWTFGDVFNLSVKWSVPLSFFSTGTNVPDDLERATRERVVERIFGL